MNRGTLRGLPRQRSKGQQGFRGGVGRHYGHLVYHRVVLPSNWAGPGFIAPAGLNGDTTTGDVNVEYTPGLTPDNCGNIPLDGSVVGFEVTIIAAGATAGNTCTYSLYHYDNPIPIGTAADDGSSYFFYYGVAVGYLNMLIHFVKTGGQNNTQMKRSWNIGPGTGTNTSYTRITGFWTYED